MSSLQFHFNHVEDRAAHSYGARSIARGTILLLHPQGPTLIIQGNIGEITLGHQKTRCLISPYDPGLDMNRNRSRAYAYEIGIDAHDISNVDRLAKCHRVDRDGGRPPFSNRCCEDAARNIHLPKQPTAEDIAVLICICWHSIVRIESMPRGSNCVASAPMCSVVSDTGLLRGVHADATTISSAPSLRKKSGVSTSMVVNGGRSRMARIISAKWRAPPSGRSSPSAGTATLRQPELSDRFGDALRLLVVERPRQPVLTLQKMHARVHVSPMIMKVACFLSQQLSHIGSACLDANGVKARAADDSIHLDIARRAGRPDPNPIWLA
jgi:hypothetical protein